MSRTNRNFLLGVLFGVAIIPVGMLGGILGLRFMNVISQVFATPGVVLSLPLHNLVPHPVWAVGVISVSNGIAWGFIFWLVGKMRK